MRRLMLVFVATFSIGCDGEDCNPLGTYTLYLSFGTGDCDNLSGPWERTYTVSKTEGGVYDVTGDPNEEIESVSAADDCRISLTSTQIAPKEVPSDTAGLVLTWSLTDVPVGNGQLALKFALCQRDFIITGHAVKF